MAAESQETIHHFTGRCSPRLNVGLRLGEAEHFLALFELAPLLQKLDPFEPFQNVPLSGNGAGSFETPMLRHKCSCSFGKFWDREVTTRGRIFNPLLCFAIRTAAAPPKFQAPTFILLRQKRVSQTSSGSSISCGAATSGVPSAASGYSKTWPS